MRIAWLPFRRYAIFSGRSSRAEFWWFLALVLIVSGALFLLLLLTGLLFARTDRGIGLVTGRVEMLALLGWLLASAIPLLAVTVRRFHDRDLPGLFALVVFIPIFGWAMFLALLLLKGPPGPNVYGSPYEDGEPEFTLSGRIVRTWADRWFERRLRGEPPPRPFEHLYDEPIEALEARARAGDGKAAYVLGDIFDAGQNCEPRDWDRAIAWYRIGADLGDGDALNNLGSMYQHGDGVDRDPGMARRYYERGAEAGCGVAMNNLGHFYRQGAAGLPKDHRRAAMWLRKGARLGAADAMTSLGFAYDNGLGVRRSLVRALYWYRRAAQHEEPGALFNLGQQYWFGIAVLKDREKGAALYLEAANQGSASAARRLATAHEYGTLPPRDLRIATRFMERAEENGDDAAAADAERLRKLFLIEGENDLREEIEAIRAMIHDPESRFSAIATLSDIDDIERMIPHGALRDLRGRAAHLRGIVLARSGVAEAAIAEIETALEIDRAERFFGERERRDILLTRADMYAGERRWEEAIADYRLLVPILATSSELTREETFGARQRLAYCLHEVGRFQDAWDVDAELLYAAEATFGEDSDTLIPVLANLAENTYALGDLTQAARLAGRRLDLAERMGAERHVSASLLQLGTIALAGGDTKAADAWLNRHLAIAEDSGDEERIAQARASLAALYAPVAHDASKQ